MDFDLQRLLEQKHTHSDLDSLYYQLSPEPPCDDTITYHQITTTAPIMVFYVPPKRQPEDRASITSLADETLLQILKDVSKNDILNLRLTCSNLVPACSTTLSKRLTTLYIHPWTNSLKRAVDICAHPVLGREIEEVILLGKVLWRDIEQAYPRCRTIPEAEQVVGRRAKELQNAFRPWPVEFPRAKNRSQLENVDFATPSTKEADRPASINHSVLSFGEAYEPLITALASLPELRKLSFAESCEGRPAFNKISQRNIDTYAKEDCTTGQGRTNMAPQLLSRSGKMLPSHRIGRRRADADIFFGLLFHPSLNLTSISIQSELPFIGDITAKLKEYSPQYLVGKLTRIDLAMDCGWPQTVCHTLYFHLLRIPTTSLRRLKLVFSPNSSIKKPNFENGVQNAIAGLSFPKLETLELKLTELNADPRPELRVKDEFLGQTRRLRHQRPVCMVFDVLGFLRRHLLTLTNVRLENVIFADLALGESSHGTTRIALELLREEGKLENLKWLVNRYEHDPRCKRKDDESVVDCRKFECGMYGAGSSVEGFEMLAGEIDAVEYDGEKRIWDFGRCVRRQVGVE